MYPDEPIGPGATWSADIVTENQGIEVPVTYHYTLTEVRDGRFTIQTTLDSDFDVEQDGIVGTGHQASGTSSGAENPLDAAASFTMALDMVSDIDGEDMTMTFNVDIEVVSVVPAS